MEKWKLTKIYWFHYVLDTFHMLILFNPKKKLLEEDAAISIL